jgi:hypothetical protein
MPQSLLKSRSAKYVAHREYDLLEDNSEELVGGEWLRTD